MRFTEDAETEYVKAKRAFDRVTTANHMPTYDELRDLETVVFAVSIRNGVSDFYCRSDTTWEGHAYFTIDGVKVHVTGQGDSIYDCAREMRRAMSEKIRWQGTGRVE